MLHKPTDLLIRAGGATFICGLIFAAGLVSHVTPTDQVMFAGLLITLITLLSVGLEWALGRVLFRFSLRTLLIAMTIAAVGLALVSYAIRK